MSQVFTQLFNLDGLEDVTASMEHVSNKDRFVIRARLARERQACPNCKCLDTTFKQKKERIFWLPPISSTEVVLSIAVKKCHCKFCKTSWWPVMPFAEGKQRFTHAFKAYAIGLLRYATVKDVAQHLGASWGVIKSIHKRHLMEAYEEIDISKVVYLSVDEIAIRKGHTYMTIFSDNLTGRIVHAVRGKKKKDIMKFLEELKKKQLTLKQLLWTCAGHISLQSKRHSQA